MEIKSEIRDWLRDNLKLELSEEKTLITHARTEAARFLGYEVSVFWSDTRPSVNGKSVSPSQKTRSGAPVAGT